jgi:hypothetical protein
MIKGVESAKLKIARAWEHLADLVEVARVYTDEEIHKLPPKFRRKRGAGDNP